ncbi:hypothetical protein [Moraxella nasicaprae]|uniref:Uncharacterized protein n=1 Tax=Moraxella nasicaprae TaxID=2904122 RepID=A0ABY6F4L8_9GAMM|nr:hypothetical protein [Moraxella nasicaprae]UXZ05038.1 hypothetical protein LU297_00865 [Moraxella nasicaprae]
MKKLLLGLLFAGLSQQVVAEIKLGYDGLSGYSMSILDEQTKGVYDSGRYVKSVWVKNEVVENLAASDMGQGGYRLDNWHIDCDSRTVGIKSMTQYDSSGRMLAVNTGMLVKYRPVVPNTWIDVIVQKSCQN